MTKLDDELENRSEALQPRLSDTEEARRCLHSLESGNRQGHIFCRQNGWNSGGELQCQLRQEEMTSADASWLQETSR